MNRNVAFDKLGGLYVYQDTLDFLQIAYSQALDGLAIGLGEKYILNGVAIAGAAVTDGFIVVNGEMMPFLGGAILANVIVETLVTKEQFDDGALKDTYTTKRAKMSAIAGAGSFPFTDLKRLPLLNSSIMDSLAKYHDILKSIINFEPEVILNGCLISAIDTGASTCNISAGLMMFNGQLKSIAAYAGTYPAYATDAGTWTTVLPGAGLYIAFDPHTSQRYADVLNRAMVKAGKIEMYETLSDRFVAGVGRWEMKGFSLLTSMQGRVPVGLWFDGVAVANVTDAAYENAGAQGGEKLHQLIREELPHFRLSINTGDRAGRSDDANDRDVMIPGGDGTSVKYTEFLGDDVPHENRQPFTVVVYVKRTA